MKHTKNNEKISSMIKETEHNSVMFPIVLPLTFSLFFWVSFLLLYGM